MNNEFNGWSLLFRIFVGFFWRIGRIGKILRNKKKGNKRNKRKIVKLVDNNQQIVTKIDKN